MQWWPVVFLALPMVTLLLEASYSDITTRKVPNRLIVMYLVIAAIGQAAVAVCWLLGVDGKDLPMDTGLGFYLLIWVTNGLLCVGTGVGMWWVGLWPAGEAKLFGAVGLLFPLWWIQRPLTGAFLGLSLLHNIFLAIFLHVIFDAAAHLFRWRKLKEQLSMVHPEKKPFDLKGSAKAFLVFVVIFLYLRLFRLEIMEVTNKAHLAERLHLDTSLIYLLMVFFFHQLKSLVAKPPVFIGGLVCLAVFAGWAVFHQKDAARLLLLVNMSGYALSIIVIRYLYDYYARVMNVTPLPVGELAQGMVLSSHTQHQIMSDRGFFEPNIETFYADGLTELQARNIQRWNEETGKVGDTVWVAHTTPIAPLIAFGAFLTWLVQGTLPVQMAVGWVWDLMKSL